MSIWNEFYNQTGAMARKSGLVTPTRFGSRLYGLSEQERQHQLERLRGRCIAARGSEDAGTLAAHSIAVLGDWRMSSLHIRCEGDEQSDWCMRFAEQSQREVQQSAEYILAGSPHVPRSLCVSLAWSRIEMAFGVARQGGTVRCLALSDTGAGLAFEADLKDLALKVISPHDPEGLALIEDSSQVILNVMLGLMVHVGEACRLGALQQPIPRTESVYRKRVGRVQKVKAPPPTILTVSKLIQVQRRRGTTETGTGRRQSPHFRRGHWRWQWVGSGSNRRRKRIWIKATEVHRFVNEAPRAGRILDWVSSSAPAPSNDDVGFEAGAA